MARPLLPANGNPDAYPTESDLDPLCGREDFKKLVTELGECNSQGQNEGGEAVMRRPLLGLGERALCLEWLEAALAEREPYLGSLMVFPGYDVIRDQRRFKRLVQALKFAT